MLDIISHQGKANETAVKDHFTRMAERKKTKTDADCDMERLEGSYIAGGNVH